MIIHGDILVSVIMSTYNEEQFIDECIHSILGQTHQNLEFIIFDDGSSDNTINIIESHKDPRLILVRNNIQRGPYPNLHEAQKMARGSYIMQMDSDDIALPTRIEKQLSFLLDNNLDMVGGWAQKFGKNVDIIKSASQQSIMNVYLLSASALAHPTLFYSRKIVDDGIMYSTELRYVADYLFQYQVCRKYRVGCLQEIVLLYRTHDKQITSDKRETQIECSNEIRRRIFAESFVSVTEDELDVWNSLFDEIHIMDMDYLKNWKLVASVFCKIGEGLFSDEVYDTKYGEIFLKDKMGRILHQLPIFKRVLMSFLLRGCI